VDPQTVSARLIGAIFVEKGLITDEQLTEALEQQRETGERVGEILVSRFGVSRLALASALAEQWAEYERPGSDESHGAETTTTDERDLEAVSAEWPSGNPPEPSAPRRPIGEIFRERGLLTDEQLDEALAAQAESGQRLGEILVERGIVSRLELASALADQWASLQKLRPPTPSAAPHAQPAPPPAPSPDTPPEAGASSPPAEVAALAERLAALESAAAGDTGLHGLETAIEELRSQLALVVEEARRPGPEPDLAPLVERLAELESRLDDTSGVDDLRARIDGLAARIAAVPQFDDAALVARLDAVEGRLQAAADAASALDERIRSALAGATDGLHAEVDSLRSRVGEAAEAAAAVDDLRAGLAAVEERITAALTVDDLAAQLVAAIEPVESRLGELSGRVELAARTAGDLEALQARADELADRVEAVASLPRAELQRLEGRLADLEQKLAEAAAAGHEDGLRAQLESLEERLAATPTATDVAGLQRQLERQLSQAADASRVDELAAALERLRALQDTTSEEIRHRLATAESERVDEAELESRLRAELAPLVREASDALSRQLAELAQRLDETTALAGSLDALAERVRSVEDRGADVHELDGRLAALASTLERSAASLRTDQDELRGQVQALLDASPAAEIMDRLASVEARLVDPESLEARLREPLDELAAAVDVIARDAAGAVALRERIGALEKRVEAGAELLARVGELECRVAEGADVEQRLLGAINPIAEASEAIRADQASLRERLREALAGLASVDSVAGRIAELEQRLDEGEELEARLREVLASEVSGQVEAVRVDQARADGALRDGIDALARRIASLDPLAARIDGLVEDVAAAGSLSNRVDELGGQLAGLEERIVSRGDHEELAGRLDSLVASLNEATERAAGAERAAAEAGSRAERGADALRDEVGQRLAEARTENGDRIDELARLLAAAEDERRSLLERIEAAERKRQEDRNWLDASLGRLESTVDERAKQASEDATQALRSELAAGRAELESGVAARIDRLGELLASSDRQREELTARLETAEKKRSQERDGLSASLARLESTIDGRALRAATQAVEGLRGELLERRSELEAGLTARVEELAAQLEAGRDERTALESRLESLERGQAEETERLAHEAAAGLDDLRRELGQQAAAQQAAVEALAGALEERDAASVDARDELRTELERAASSLGWRLERVEQALAEDDGAELRASVEELGRRLEAQAAVAEEHVRVTEKAVRKGLASLGERLAETEQSYVEAGGALRRSIERLGLAIEDADRRIEERDPLEAGGSAAATFLAYAPAEDGYRLVEIEGAAPAVGAKLRVPGIEGKLRVTRVGSSPLPFDERACVYLERRRAG
jgi:chromosome segregation ATPase